MMILKKVRLIEVYPELEPDFKLSFYRYTDEGEAIKLFNKSEDMANKKEGYLPFKEITVYKEQLRNEFKEVRVGFDGFPIPIDQIIELPFFRVDKRKEEQRHLLKNELKLLEKEQEKNKGEIIEFKQDSVLMGQLKDEIFKITAFLNRKNKPLEVLDKQDDIFILSPAGSGKTTTLKWFAYKLTYQNNQLPIFIELQSYKSDLTSLIKHSLKLYKLDFEVIRNHKHLVLLIDGFDEYSGDDQTTLVREIRNFKKEYNCQIVFSGRYKPLGLGEKEFYTYRLSEFDDNDIQRIFNNVFPEKGERYYNTLLKADLLESINIPLFLMFLIAHLKKQGQFNLKKVRALLENKGKLLETVLIDDFLNEYEHKKSAKLQEHQWLELKTKQIELISLFAYYLTFELNNKENAHKENEGVIEYLKTHANPLTRYENIDYEQLLIDFKGHSILSFKRDFIGFDKKEVRLFFAAYYLVSQIENTEDFKKYNKVFKGDENSWNSIGTYLFGLIEPNKIMKEVNSFFVEEQIIYNNAFILQIEYALKFIKSGNTDVKHKLLNKLYFLNTLGLTVFNDLKFVKNDKSKKRFILDELFFFLIRKVKHSSLTHVSSLIPNANYHYLHSVFDKPIVTLRSTYEMADILDERNNRKVFKDLNIDTDSFKKYDYSLSKTPISINNLDCTLNLIFSLLNTLIFDNTFYEKSIKYENSDFRTKAVSKSHYQSELKYAKLFLKNFFKLYANAYLDFYFKTHSPTIFNLKTLYLYFKKQNVRISSNKILPETKEKIINHFNEVAYHSKNKYRLVIMIFYAFKTLLDSEMKRELLASWKEKILDKNTSKKIKSTLVQVLFRHLQDEDVPLFLSLLLSENERIRHNAIFGLSLYIARLSNKDKELIAVIFDSLHDLFNNTNVNYKGIILSAFQSYRVIPPESFIKDIIKFADNEEIHYYSAIMFFGHSQIKEAEPYLIKVLDEKNEASPKAYEALVNIDAENFYKYDTRIKRLERILIEGTLSNLQAKILKHSLERINIKILDDCVEIGDENTLKKLKETYDIILKKNIAVKPSEKQAFINAIDTLEIRIERLKRTNHYLTHILPRKKSSDDKSED